MNVNIGILIAVLFVIGIILDAVIVKIVGKNLPQESEQTQEDQFQEKSYRNIENDDLADTSESSPKQEMAKTIEKMREISTRQLNTKEGDQEIAKLCHDIVVLFDEWEDAINTGTIDEFGEVKTHLINLVTLYQNALQGQGSFPVVLDNLTKIQSIVSILAELAKKRLANKNAISTGMGLDQLKTAAYNALSLEESSNQGIT